MGVRRELAAALLLLSLVGCGKGASSQVSSLPRLSAAPSPVAATVSEANPAGAAEFARHFYAQITRAFATADPSLVSALARPGCVVCARYIGTLTKLRNNHERTTPVTFTVHFAAAPPTDGKTARVDVQFDVPASTRYDSAGRVIYREQASVRVNETLKLVWVGRGWLVEDIT